MTYITEKDFSFEARRGNVSGVTKTTTIGHANDVGTSLETLMPGAGSISPDALIATPATVKVSSTDANDTSAGSGARTLLLSGLDSSGVVQTETITLNGQTEVVSVNTYKWIQSFAVTSVGATTWNEGTIWVGTGTVTAGVPATKLCSAEIGANISAVGAYMVPASKVFHPTQLTVIMGDSTKTINVDIYIRNVTTGIYAKAFEANTVAGYWVQPVVAFTGQAAGTVIELRASVSAGTASVTSALAGYLEAV